MSWVKQAEPGMTESEAVAQFACLTDEEEEKNNWRA